MRKKTATCVVNDQAFLRAGMVQHLSNRGFKVVAEAASKAEARKLVKLHKPRLLITEIVVANHLCFDLIQEFRTASNQTAKVLVASRQDEIVFAERSLRAGANGYVSLNAAESEFELAVKSVLDGDVYLSDQTRSAVLGRMIGHDQPSNNYFDLLTQREMEVFLLTGRGLPPREIADDMDVSVKTVESYREKIKEKLGLRSSHEVLRYAMECVMLDFHDGSIIQPSKPRLESE